MIARVIVLTLALISSATAQGTSQPPPGTDWQSIIVAVKRQRDAAMDAAAVAEARVVKLTEELQRMKEAKPEEPKQ
jgi:hypothetical protein